MGKARRLHFEAGELVHEIVGGGLALDGRIDRDHQLLDPAPADALDELADRQILGADALERRQDAAENMIGRIQRLGAFERPEIGDVLHHHDHGLVPRGIAADGAGIARIDIAADRTLADLLQRIGHGGGQRTQDLFALLHELQGGAARRAGTETRKLGEQLDQALDFRSCDCLGHGVSNDFLGTRTRWRSPGWDCQGAFCRRARRETLVTWSALGVPEE